MTPLLHERTSHMTEIAERTLASTFHRVSPEVALYQDCPSAFWLAPGGDEALPVTNGPTFDRPAGPVTDHATSVGGAPTAIGAAMVAAGPMFLPLLILTLPESGSVLDRLGMILAGSIIALPFTIIVGTILSVIPAAIGTLALSALGRRRALARTRQVWAATGAGMALAISGLVDAGPVSIPLIITAVACAVIAHSRIHWIDAEPALPLPRDGGMASA